MTSRLAVFPKNTHKMNKLLISILLARDSDWTTKDLFNKMYSASILPHNGSWLPVNMSRWRKRLCNCAFFSMILSPQFVSIFMSKCSLTKNFHQRLKLVSKIIGIFSFYSGTAKFIYHSRLHLSRSLSPRFVVFLTCIKANKNSLWVVNFSHKNGNLFRILL